MVYACWFGEVAKSTALENGLGDAAWIAATQYRHQLPYRPNLAPVAAVARAINFECGDRDADHDLRHYARVNSSFCGVARGVNYFVTGSSLVKVQVPIVLVALEFSD